MFLDIDHIAISSMQFDEHIRILKSLGYGPKFIEHDIKNLTIKRELQEKFSESHDLALLTSKNGLGIELVNHRNIHHVEPYIIPIFENFPSNLINESNEDKLEKIGTKVNVKSFNMPAYVNQNETVNGFNFNKMIIKTKNIEKSVNFWELFGFNLTTNYNNTNLLTFKSLLNKKTYDLYLQTDDKIFQHYLDDQGPNCIAFISNSVANEKKLLMEKNIDTTEIERLETSEKSLDIFFAKGPSGEIVEIISTPT